MIAAVSSFLRTARRNPNIRVTEIELSDKDWRTLCREGQDRACYEPLRDPQQPIEHISFDGVRVVPRTRSLTYRPRAARPSASP